MDIFNAVQLTLYLKNTICKPIIQTVFRENLPPHCWNKSSNDLPRSSITKTLWSPEKPYDFTAGIPTN